MSQDNYGVKDIKTLEGIEAIRLRPGMYIGSTGPEGVQHITLEIISNVVDEYLNGYCTKCKIGVGNYITVADDGRGVPFGKAEDGSETLVNVFTKLHTGAKFDSSGKTGYNTSGGMNGVGAKATNALSETFSVCSVRDGKAAEACFKEGKLISYKERENTSKTRKHGTSIQFKPDSKIFKETTELDYDKLHKQIQELAYLSPGLIFEFTYKDKPMEIITSKNGILDYIKDLNEKKETLTSVFYAEKIEDRIGVKVAMQYNNSYSDNYKLFTNSIPNSAGTHLTGFRTALTQSVNKYARENKLLKEKDSNLIGDELKEGLVLVLSFIMPDPVFSGQTKDVLSSSEARTMVQQLVSTEITNWLQSNPKDAKIIVEKALLARQAKEKAKKAKEAIRNVETKGKNKLLNLPTKLVDAWGKKRTDCELLIAEGDSAASGLIGARDGEKQAVFPIRGKIINLYKNSSEKVFANQEVINIIKALGLDLDSKTHKIIYDKNKMRYGKILLCADADPDGEAIKNLLLTCFWSLCPDLVVNGHIYATIPPLFRITTKKNEYIYLRDADALEEYKIKHQGEKYLINRNKGLGEQDPEELEECLLNPETRNIAQITVQDVAKAAELFEVFMGPSVGPRRDWIMKHSEEANEI